MNKKKQPINTTVFCFSLLELFHHYLASLYFSHREHEERLKFRKGIDERNLFLYVTKKCSELLITWSLADIF